MARYSPTVRPYATDYGALAEAFMRGRGRRLAREEMERQRTRQDEADLVNLHRAGYRRGAERPTTPQYEASFEGTVFDPARQQMPAALPNAFTGARTQPQEPMRAAFDAQAPQLQGGGNAFADALGSVSLARGNQPRLKALPGAFLPETGTFADRPLFEQPPAPFQIGAGRMVERPDMGYERVGDNLWFSEERSPEGRQMARAALVADAERLNQEAAAEKQRTMLGAALEGLGHLSPGQREAIAAGVPAQFVFPQQGSPTGWQTVQTAGGFMQINPQTGDVRPLVGPDGRPIMPISAGDPNDPTGASATSRLNRYAQAVRSVSDALQRYQASVLRETFEPATPEMLENFLRNTFNIGLDDFYAMQGELFKLWGVEGGEEAPPVQQASPNPFLRPNPFTGGGHGGASVLGDALARAASGGAPQVGPTVEAAASLPPPVVTTPALAQDEIDEARAYVSRIQGHDEQRAVLAEAGYNEAEIAAILGDGGR